LRQLVLDEAQRIADEDVQINRRMAEHGPERDPHGARAGQAHPRAGG
jgi:hypothetical protein